MLCGFNLHRSYSWGHNYHDFIHTTTLSCPENVVSLRSTISGSSKMMLELWEERVGLRHMSHSGLSILMSLSLCTLTSCESWPVVNLCTSCESQCKNSFPFFFFVSVTPTDIRARWSSYRILSSTAVCLYLPVLQKPLSVFYGLACYSNHHFHFQRFFLSFIFLVKFLFLVTIPFQVCLLEQDFCNSLPILLKLPVCLAGPS